MKRATIMQIRLRFSWEKLIKDKVKSNNKKIKEIINHRLSLIRICKLSQSNKLWTMTMAYTKREETEIP